MSEAHTLAPDALLEHAVFLRGLAASLVRDPSLQDDAVQETWLAALRRPPRAGPVRGWLATVMRNAVRKHWRAADRRQAREQRAARPDHAPSVGESAAQAELVQRVVHAVCTLDAPYRDVVFLRFYDGLPPRQIADRLDLPVSTVKSRLHRALGKLRSALDEDHSAWRGGLIALFGLRLPGAAAATLSAGATTMGASVVGSPLKIIAAVAAVCLVGWGGWRLAQPGEATHEGGTHASIADGLRHPANAIQAELHPLGPLVEPSDMQGQLPDPVDFALVDRERDLHGVVVEPDGTPISGALLQTFRHPWRVGRTRTLGDVRHETVEGPSTTSARDGSFRIPLPVGYAGNLRARAEGRAHLAIPRIQAGERLRVVLGPATPLRLHVLDPQSAPLPGVRVELHGSGRGGAAQLERKGLTDDEGLHIFHALPAGAAVDLVLFHPSHGFAHVKKTLRGEGPTDITHAFAPGRVLRGTVTDVDSGLPIVGARVGIHWTATPHVLTDNEGRFELPGWRDEVANQISAHAQGYPIRVETVESRTELHVQLRRGVSIEGRVIGRTGPVSAGLVSVVSPDDGGSGSKDVTCATGTLDTDGRFHLPGLVADRPHTIVLMVESYGHTLYDVDAVGTLGETLDVGDLHLKPPHSVAGVVRHADGRPAAHVPVDLQGANQDRARLRASGQIAQLHFGTRFRRVTDDLGRFRFAGLSGGTYALTVRPDGARALHQQVVLPDDGDITDLEIEFAATRPLEVRVLGPDGQPIAGAFVTALGRAGGGGKVRTDAEGVAHMEVRPDVERIRVFVLGAGHPFMNPQFKPLPKGARDLVFRLDPASRVRGRLLDPEGRPVAKAHLRIEPLGKTQVPTFTDNEGAFEVLFEPPGPISIVFDGQVHGGRYLSLVAEARDVADAAEPLTLRARRIAEDGQIHVVVLGPDGDPIEGANVSAQPATSGWVTQSDARGRAHLQDLLVRPLTISVWPPHDAAPPLVRPPTVTATPNGQEIVFRLKAAVLLRGTVYNQDGKPQAAAAVRVWRQDRLLHMANTGPAGTFAFPVDPDPTHDLRIEATFRVHQRLHRAVRENVAPTDASLRLDLKPVK